jgi:hypothetical protein
LAECFNTEIKIVSRMIASLDAVTHTPTPYKAALLP